MFCNYCQTITIKALIDAFQHFRMNGGYSAGYYRNPPPESNDPRSLYLAHHPSYSSLADAAQAGCEFCFAIRTELSSVPGRATNIKQAHISGADTRVRLAIGQTQHYGRWRMFDHIAVIFGEPTQTTSMNEETYHSWLKKHEIDSFWIKFSLWRPADALDSLNQFADGGVGWPYMGTDFGCRENFNLARKWLTDCSERCPEENCLTLHDVVLPTRVIDIGASRTSSNPRLLISQGIRGRYVALSHCWGGDIPSKTTKALLDQYLECLPALPKSFEDAIRITKELGFQYLWIDSLCIIQDSPEDWQTESSAMRDVYRNAAITLAAASSTNSHGGMLNSYGYDQPKVKRYCHLQLHPSSPRLESVQLSSFYEKETFMECIDELPLSHRAWTLQERLLSQRILHYGKDQIYFQCRTNHLNADRTPVQDSYSIQRRSNRALLNLSKPPEQDILPKNQIATSGDWVNEAWRGVISAYTGCRELTMPSDKLPALSGIVSLFQAKTNDQYVAGLWKADLLHGLLWRLGDYTGTGSLNWRSFSARAPSWSWASWDGLITFPFNAMKKIQDKYNAILMSPEVQTKGLNPYGEVSKGCLRLKCWTRTMTFKEITETIGLPALDRPRPNWPQNPSRQFESQESCLQEDHVYTVVCVGTFQFGPPSNTPKGYLLLDPVSTEGVEEYRRVGMAPHVSWNYLDNFDPEQWKQTDLTVV